MTQETMMTDQPTTITEAPASTEAGQVAPEAQAPAAQPAQEQQQQQGEAQQTEASLRRGLADITAGRTVDLGSFAQPEPEQLGGSNFMAWMADRLADPEVLAGYLAAHEREVREQIASELIPVVAHKGPNDTDLSLLDEAAHKLEHGYSIRDAIRIARKEQP